MANAHGPDPIFTDRLNVKVRREMREELDRLATALGITTSDVVRIFLTMALDITDETHSTLIKEPAHGEV